MSEEENANKVAENLLSKMSAEEDLRSEITSGIKVSKTESIEFTPEMKDKVLKLVKEKLGEQKLLVTFKEIREVTGYQLEEIQSILLVLLSEREITGVIHDKGTELLDDDEFIFKEKFAVEELEDD